MIEELNNEFAGGKIFLGVTIWRLGYNWYQDKPKMYQISRITIHSFKSWIKLQNVVVPLMTKNSLGIFCHKKTQSCSLKHCYSGLYQEIDPFIV